MYSCFFPICFSTHLTPWITILNDFVAFPKRNFWPLDFILKQKNNHTHAHNWKRKKKQPNVNRVDMIWTAAKSNWIISFFLTLPFFNLNFFWLLDFLYCSTFHNWNGKLTLIRCWLLLEFVVEAVYHSKKAQKVAEYVYFSKSIGN